MIKIKTNDFNLKQTLECGQFFRFKQSENYYIVQITDKIAKVWQEKDSIFITSNYENISFWKNFFDLNTDYAGIKEELSKNKELKKIIDFGSGIHILKQEFSETLISFIMSQNKQIPQIKQCIELFCEKYGKEIIFENKKYYTFPNIKEINVSLEDLRDCKVGFRDKYILNAVKKYQEGVFDNIELKTSSKQQELLLNVKGIGPKVCNCIMLFGLHRTELFPIDVWIKRIMQDLYFESKETPLQKIQKIAEDKYGEYGGYAQQYLFFYQIANKK